MEFDIVCRPVVGNLGCHFTSGVATGVARGQSATPDTKKNCQKSGKRGENRKERGKRQKSGRSFFFHFAPPDR